MQVKEFVEKVMEAVQEELTHKAKTEQRRLTRNTKKKVSVSTAVCGVGGDG